MRYATVQGVITAWWLRAIEGTTLSKLHWDWRAGTSLRGALTSGRHMGLLGLACVFSYVVVSIIPHQVMAKRIQNSDWASSAVN